MVNKEKTSPPNISFSSCFNLNYIRAVYMTNQISSKTIWFTNKKKYEDKINKKINS